MGPVSGRAAAFPSNRHGVDGGSLLRRASSETCTENAWRAGGVGGSGGGERGRPESFVPFNKPGLSSTSILVSAQMAAGKRKVPPCQTLPCLNTSGFSGKGV